MPAPSTKDIYQMWADVPAKERRHYHWEIDQEPWNELLARDAEDAAILFSNPNALLGLPVVIRSGAPTGLVRE